ncbi:hypothetical protein BH11MYX3_BH11MYX3_24220 [soil metagenome]
MRRDVVEIDDLTPLQCEQLVIVGRKFDGRPRSAEARLRDEPIPDDAEEWMDWDDGNLGAHGLTVSQAWDAGEHLYDVWIHHGGDNGCVFTAGTSDVIAGRFQDTWMDPDGNARHALHKELKQAEANED